MSRSYEVWKELREGPGCPEGRLPPGTRRQEQERPGSGDPNLHPGDPAGVSR